MTDAFHILVPTGSEQVTAQCWSCGDMLAAHFCDGCGKLQPAAPTDYFTFFGLSRKLTMDMPGLEREYYRLSRKLHPDLFAGSAAQEQQWSLEKSSQLNDAYRTLRDPIARTEYLLKLEGVQLEEQSQTATRNARATGTEKQQIVPPDLLEEVFELNMQLEELRGNRKVGEQDENLERELTQQEDNFSARMKLLDEELRGAWMRWDALIARSENGDAGLEPEYIVVRDQMVALLNRRTYLRNLVRDVKDALAN